MLYQHPYHHPLIPRSTALAPTPPYVGGELAALTSNTPFYRGQGIPLYEETTVCRKMNFGSANYGAAITVGLAKRAKGDSVKTLQRKLKALGMYTDDIDGDFYTNTEAALKKFPKSELSTSVGNGRCSDPCKTARKEDPSRKGCSKRRCYCWYRTRCRYTLFKFCHRYWANCWSVFRWLNCKHHNSPSARYVYWSENRDCCCSIRCHRSFGFRCTKGLNYESI